MYSSLYGSLPIVRATGGLDDTVENYNERNGNRAPDLNSGTSRSRALFYTMGWAVSTWYDRPHHYKAMQQQGHGAGFHMGIIGPPVRDWCMSALTQHRAAI